MNRVDAGTLFERAVADGRWEWVARAALVAARTYQSDSEGIEHHVSDETLAAFARQVKRAGEARREPRAKR